MKKLVALLSLFALIGILAACGNDADSSNAEGIEKIKIAAASVPHAEVLEHLADDIKADGVELEISIVSDGIQANQLVAEGELDANFFQHVPYLNSVNEEAGLDLVEVVGVHIEPFGVYSKKITSIDDLPQNAVVAIPNNPTNLSRSLILLAENGIIELEENPGSDYGVDHITKNEKNIEFKAVDAALLNRTLEDVDAAAINTNYALEGGLDPTKDALIREDADSPYVNILVSNPEDKDSEAIQTIAKWLTSEKARAFYEENYAGAVVPAF